MVFGNLLVAVGVEVESIDPVVVVAGESIQALVEEEHIDSGHTRTSRFERSVVELCFCQCLNDIQERLRFDLRG